MEKQLYSQDTRETGKSQKGQLGVYKKMEKRYSVSVME